MPSSMSVQDKFTARRTVELKAAKPAAGAPAEKAGTQRLSVVVVGDDHFATHPLPAFGAVTIGRASTNGISISSATLSRHHAVLHIGAELEIEDLGSANGTRAAGKSVEPGQRHKFDVGAVLEFGSLICIVQQTSTVAHARRIWSHDAFEARLESECARAAEVGGSFAVMRVHVPLESVEIAQGVLHETARPGDLVALFAPGEYEVLLVDTTSARASAAARRIGALLSSIGGRVGLATFRTDGTSPDELVAHASRAVNAGAPVKNDLGAPVIVEDPAMRDLYRLIDRVAQGTISVLLLGETGVGKEVTAEAVHRMSPRADQPLLRLNCAALSASLLESELFGHRKGAFTGATTDKPGLLESADGGTVFLDEIGELPMSIQVKLLRVLEERKVRRVGELEARPIDVRFVAATNRVLEQEIALGHFREDLYYRLAGVTLRIPPLRERKGDIVRIAREFAAGTADGLGKQRPSISDEALNQLQTYSWPGNVRELRNVMERAVLLAGDGAIEAEHLPLEKMRATVLAQQRAATAPAASLVGSTLSPAAQEGLSPADTGRIRAPSHHAAVVPPPLRPMAPAVPLPPVQAESLAEGSGRQEAAPIDEKHARLLEALRDCAGNQTRAAQKLGVSRRTLVNWLNKYGIARPRKRSE